MQDRLSVTCTSAPASQFPETLACFVVENNPCGGTRVLSQCVLRPGTSPSMLLRLTQLVEKDLLAMQKIHLLCDESFARARSNSNSVYSNNSSSSFTNPPVTDAAICCKLTHLRESSVSLASLFCHSPALCVHIAASFVVSAPPAHWSAACARLHMAFPALRDWLHMACQRLLAQAQREDNAARAWSRRLPPLAQQLSRWLRAGIAWREIALRSTVFPLRQMGTREKAQLAAIVSTALEHYCCVLRGDSAALVERWVWTVALFMQDAQLTMASAVCRRQVHEIVPDLSLQGTTCTVSEITAVLPLFRRPPVVLDVGKDMHEPHHVFSLLTLIGFGERRLAAARGSRVDWSGQFCLRAVRRAVSPLTEGVLRRVHTAIHSTSPSCGTSRLECESSFGSDSSHTTGLLSTTSGVDEISSDAASRALLVIAHWRCEVQLRALSLIVSDRCASLTTGRRSTVLSPLAKEITSNEVKEPRVSVTPMHASDRRVLEVAVVSYTRLREATEVRNLETIVDRFTF